MLLVIDIGNTNTVMGVYAGDRRISDWRIRTERNTTEDEFNVLASHLFAESGTPDGVDFRSITNVMST